MVNGCCSLPQGHGLLDDDMSVSFAYGKHAFYNIDSLVDLLMSVGMRPIFELSFMPYVTFPRCERVNLDAPNLRVESRMGVSLGVLGTGPGRAGGCAGCAYFAPFFPRSLGCCLYTARG